MYQYEEIVTFANMIDTMCEAITSSEKSVSKEGKRLEEKTNNSRSHVMSLKNIVSCSSVELSSEYDIVNSTSVVAEARSIDIKNLLRDYRSTIVEINKLNHCISCLMHDIPMLEKNIDTCRLYISKIESHDCYKKWVKSSEKYLKKNIIPDDETAGLNLILIDNELSEILNILQSMSSLIQGGATKLKAAVLYSIYKSTKNDSVLFESNDGYIEHGEKRLASLEVEMMFLKQFRDKICAEAKELLCKYEAVLAEDEDALHRFPHESEQKLKAMVLNSLNSVKKKIDSDVLRAQLYAQNNSFIDWKTGKLKETSDERYTFSLHKGKFKKLSSSSTYVQKFRELLFEEYDYLIKDESRETFYYFPEIININTFTFNYIIDATKMCDLEDKTIMNSMIQNFVATTIANFPPGKIKFLFCDPDSTGVFSIFRDIGKIKDDVDDSISCEYAGSADTITKRLDNICVEIDDIVNKVIKGTTTTLYDHNRDNEFNSMPYRFIMLMDFPRNMTSSSLSSLRSILKNGPRCGIFTVLVNISGEAMNYLDEKLQVIVQEIVKSPSLIYRNKRLYDTYNNEFGSFSTELVPKEFDQYIQVYNKRQKDNEGFKIDISSLDAPEVKGGGYSIPVGRSKGGKIESIAFFDHCQNYLLSGAIGRGKSNALHVIIHNSLKYIKNLDLYLIDFKHGVEFAPYARINHPAFKVLAIESAPEFGYSVLTHINDKIARIGEIFRENGVENWTELYKKTGQVIPVTLIVMDEFQHLFEGEHGKQCSEIIEFIAKEGRVFNVHLFLSSQTVNNLSGLTDAAKQMIFGRIVFFNDQVEYKSMLWDDDKLAKTFDPDIKGQAILATGKEHQRFIQFALKKPIEETISELTYPVDEVVNRTKIMLSAVHENPYSIYNRFLNGDVTFTDDCEFVIGDDITIEPSDIKQRVEDENYAVVAHPYDIKSIQLKHRQNDNVLILGNDERKAETIFMFNLLCTLMKQMTQHRINSISLIMVTTATDLYNFAMKFPKYIKIYTTSDLLTDAVKENTEYLFVFGLHAFSSMKFSVDDPYKKVNATSQINGGIIIGDTPMQTEANVSYSTDGEMLRNAIDNSACNVIIWHNDAVNLANMFGTTANFSSFNNKFLHKICLPMSTKDSELFLGTDSGSKLSDFAIVYKFLNNEKILRTYNRFEYRYLNKMINRLNEVSES